MPVVKVGHIPPPNSVATNLDMGMEVPELRGSSQQRSWKLLSWRLSYRFLVPSSALRELFAAVSDAFSTVLETFSSWRKCAVVVRFWVSAPWLCVVPDARVGG